MKNTIKSSIENLLVKYNAVNEMNIYHTLVVGSTLVSPLVRPSSRDICGVWTK